MARMEYARGGITVVFGASVMCEICIRHFESLGISVDMICDNNTDRHGGFVTDNGRIIKVVSVAEAMANPQKKLCFVAAGARHFEVISGQLKRYDIAETVMKWHLDFYMETLAMLKDGASSFMNRIEELLGFYEDEESLKILWGHFAMLFDLEYVPDELKAVTMEGICVRPQYFLENGRYLGKQSIMVDCGAFVGDTLENLVHEIKYSDFEQYDCYEISLCTYNELKRAVDRLPNEIKSRVHMYNVGVAEREGGIKIANTAIEDNCCISHNASVEAMVVRLDDVYTDKNISFIKMDIEGSEQSALRGGRDVISRCRPMCAICVYHTLAAFWEVPQLLREYVPEYRMILRHHTAFWDDTVCYAKIGEWKRRTSF